MSTPIDSSVKVKPFSSDTDKTKHDLLLDADIYRDKLENQWSDLKVEATTYGKQALVIGGVIATTFVVMNAFLPKSKKDKEKELEKKREKDNELLLISQKRLKKEKSQSQVVQAVQSLAWTLAVGWARQKLKHLIDDERRTE
jgi:Na+/glutamate symporter